MKLTIVVFLLALTGCNNQQKVIFEAGSISWENKYDIPSTGPGVKRECEAISTSLSSYMTDGWKVVSSSPKTHRVYNDMGECIGTEYILEK